jgi:hypothetical protein
MGEDGDKGTLGIQVMQFGIDPIDITTEENPYGGIGTYRVNMTNIGVSYGKSFSKSISAGVTARLVTEGIPDASATGMSLDAGVQYSTPLLAGASKIKRNDFNFGVSVKNIESEPASFHKLDSIMLHWADVNRLLYPTINGQIDTIMQTSTGMWFKLTNRGSFLEIAYGTHADIQEDKKWVRCNDYFVAKQMEKEATRKIQDERDAKKKAESKPVAVVTKALEDDVI